MVPVDTMMPSLYLEIALPPLVHHNPPTTLRGPQDSPLLNVSPFSSPLTVVEVLTM